jgi:predicted ATPase
LLRIRDEARPYYDRIIAHIRQAAPYFGDFVFLKSVQPPQVTLCWKERYADKIYYPAQLSDGSIRLICLATLLLQPNPPQTIIIDEPELGLHPSAINVLVGMLTLASEKCQVIVCTQSPQLVNCLEPGDLIVVNRKGGETTFSRPDEKALGHWLEDYSLGELWEKDLMGGRPQP